MYHKSLSLGSVGLGAAGGGFSDLSPPLDCVICVTVVDDDLGLANLAAMGIIMKNTRTIRMAQHMMMAIFFCKNIQKNTHTQRGAFFLYPNKP